MLAKPPAEAEIVSEKEPIEPKEVIKSAEQLVENDETSNPDEPTATIDSQGDPQVN